MPAKLEPEVAAPKAKAKAKAGAKKEQHAKVAKVIGENEVAFNEVRDDCDYPREES